MHVLEFGQRARGKHHTEVVDAGGLPQQEHHHVCKFGRVMRTQVLHCDVRAGKRKDKTKTTK